MSGDDSYSVAARYRTVRKHLDSLGYKQALSFDALPLIERLLADLIQTTDSLKHFKTIAQENIEVCSQLQSTVDPYKCDNIRLVQECNQLHGDLIVSKELYQRQVKDLKKHIYKLEYECNDLQLASSRNLHKIKELETESSKKSKKILELQGKCLKPTISNVALASKQRACYPLRRPVLEGEPPTKAGTSTSLPTLSTPEPKVLNLLTMADHRMNSLSHEITKLKGELSMQTDNVHVLKNQLSSKEKEVLRLKNMLEGGRPYVAVSKDCVCKQSDDNFMSYDYTATNECHSLQQEKLELEQRLKETVAKQHDAMTQALKLAERNEELEKELRDIDHIALAVEADCNSAVKENNKRVSKLQEKLEDAMTQLRVLEGELNVERKEVQELRADLEVCRLEKRNIQRTLESTSDEKKKMMDRVNELTIIEKSLNNEIERLSKENEAQRQDIVELHCNNRILKEQISLRGTLQSGSTKDSASFKEKGDKNDQNKASKNHRDVHFTYATENNDVEFKDRDCLVITLQETIRQLRNERDYYRSEYNNIKEIYDRTPDDNNSELWSRIRELNRQLIEKENALDDAQREKRDMVREKSNLEKRLEICRCEHKQSCQPCSICKRGICVCSCSLGSVGSSGGTKTMLDRLEHERDTARADVGRLIQERDMLRERLQMAAETHTTEQRRMRDNLLDLESRLKHIEKEKQDLVLTQGTRRATINGLEDQLDDMREELRRTKQELATQRTQYIQLRALQDQTDQALGDVQCQLTQSEAELNKASDRNRAMERQQIQFDSQVKELKQEINTLRSKMTHIDHDKDQLLMVLDEKTERIAGLEREIMGKEQQVIGMQQQVRELQHKHDICIDQSAEQERQLRSTQLEMENLQRQLEGASADRENAIQENRRLQDDLAAVTCEIRNLQRELEASRVESYDLKRQLQTYVSEVRRAEELLNRKDSERTEMLNHFRSLSFEASVLENNNHSLESEAAEAKGALQNARDQLLDLEQQLANQDSLAKGYETQISKLTQAIANMETQLRQESEQRLRAEADLKAVRNLCVKLDQQKDALMEKLGDRDCLKTQYDSQIGRLKAEQNIIQDQMDRDRATVQQMENLLDQARQESMNAHASNQELQNEVLRLKQRISELQSKLSAGSEELRQYQNQAAEYSKQISELRRQVTNERFDRARKEEESRRYLQKEDPERCSVAREHKKDLAEQSEGLCSAKNFACCRGKGVQCKRLRPCICSPKTARKTDNVTHNYANSSNIEKPLFESTTIDENGERNANNFTMPAQEKLTLSSNSWTNADPSKGGETLKVTFNESPDDLKRNRSSLNKFSEPADETHDLGLQATKRAQSMYSQNNSLTNAKLIKEETNTCTKMCGRRMYTDNGSQAYQQHACALKQCNKYESTNYRTHEANFHDPSDKHSLRKEDYNVSKSRTHAIVDADTVSSVLLRYLPTFNLSGRKKKEVSSTKETRDQTHKHPNKASNIRHEDASIMGTFDYAENIKAPASSCAPCCNNNSKDANAKCGGTCPSLPQMEENHSKASNSTSTQHQCTMTELRDEMLAKIESAQSDLMKTLIEIKEHTKNLEEELAIMNGHINSESYSKASKQNRSVTFKGASSDEEATGANTHVTQKNENTQEPDKKNASVQTNEYSVCVS